MTLGSIRQGSHYSPRSFYVKVVPRLDQMADPGNRRLGVVKDLPILARD